MDLIVGINEQLHKADGVLGGAQILLDVNGKVITWNTGIPIKKCCYWDKCPDYNQNIYFNG